MLVHPARLEAFAPNNRALAARTLVRVLTRANLLNRMNAAGTRCHTLLPAFMATGTYTNVPGAASPYTDTVSEPQKFSRLQVQ